MYFLSLILFFPCLASYCQDPEFSQYYASPLHLNPAFSGSANGHRFLLNHRNQWPNTASGFVTSAFAYDLQVDQFNSGMGLLLMMDRAGSANLKSTQLNFQYAYKVNFNNKWILSSGLNFGLGWRTIDFNKLLFGDQLEFDVTGTIPSDDPITGTIRATNYFDLGIGGLLYNRTVWLGFSMFHLNNPNRSLIDEEAEIPVKTSIHGGFRVPLNRGPWRSDRAASLAPSFVYKKQGRFDQLDIGAYVLYEPLIVGLWYRGIPLQQDIEDQISQDAVVVILGFELNPFEVAYSYDVTISKLGPVSSGGSHEISLKYMLNLPSRIRTNKRDKKIPCPTHLKGQDYF